jgi:hypothetical protein
MAARNELCGREPLYWLQNHTNTRDEHWQQKGTRSFARFPDLPYMPVLFHMLNRARHLFVPKSRDMMVTWAVMGYLVWKCQWFPATSVMVQCQKEEKVCDLVVGRGAPGYARTLYDQQDEFLKDLHTLIKPSGEMPGDLMTWKNGSSIHGVPRGADQVRQYHPSVMFFDEACFLDEFAESYEAALPVASQIIAVSSAAPSWFGDICEEAIWA